MTQHSFKGSVQFKFFENERFESIKNKTRTEQNAVVSRNALRLMMMGWPLDSWTQLLSWPVLKAVFVERDPELLKQLRFAFQQGFLHVFEQLKGKKVTKEQNEQAQLYLSNCLSILPYSDLTPYETVKIPQNIAGVWELVEYHVKPIELTSPLSKNKDRVFAYGLESLVHPTAKSHLIFMGTTYPAGQGFVPQIYTDFEAFETAGTSLYLSGRTRVLDWLQNQKDKIHVCGVSLGGSLSLLLAADLGEYLERVDALNPPGFYEAKKKNSCDRWDACKEKPHVVVQMQADDPVSRLGVWKPEWNILEVIPPRDKKGPIAFCDHFLNYAGLAGTEFNYVSSADENIKRRTRNLFLYSLVRSAIYYGVLVPYIYLIRPVLYFIANNKASLAYGVAALSGLILGIGLLSHGIISLTLLISAGVILGLSVVSLVSSALLDYFSPSKQALPPHAPSLPRNEALDIYNKKELVWKKYTPAEINTYNRLIRPLAPTMKVIPEPKEDLTVGATKADAYFMGQSLTFFKRFGEGSEFTRAVKEEYKAYEVGVVV